MGRRGRRCWVQAAGIERLEDRTLLSWFTPIGYGDSYTVHYDVLDTEADGEQSVLANDVDYDGPWPLTAVLVSGPSHGTLTFYSNGHFIYEPDPGFSGSDGFTYRPYDGTNYGSPTGVSLSVIKPFGPALNAEDRPSAPAASFGPFGASPFTGDVQVVQPIGGGLTLQYHALSDPRPVLAVESAFTPGTVGGPNGLEATLTFDDTPGDPVYYASPAWLDTFRFALQADASGLPTGRYDWGIDLVASYSNGKTATHVFSGTTEIVNLSDSVFGAGWTVSQLDRLVAGDGGMLYVSGTGLTGWFEDDGQGGFNSPVGPLRTFTLIENQDDTFTLSDKHGNAAHYTAAGLLTSRVDRNGLSTSFAYTDGNGDNEANELWTVTDAWNRVVTFTYVDGLLSEVEDHAGRVTTLVHDGSGRLIEITRPDPDGEGELLAPTTEFGYDGTSFRLDSIVDPLLRESTIEYDFAGRIASATFADLETQSFTIWQTRGLADLSQEGTQQNPAPLHYPNGTMSALVDPLNRTTEQRFDRFGFLTYSKDPLGNVTTWQRNADGLVTVLTQPDPDGSGTLYTSPVTTFQYDSNQNLTQITFPDNTTQSWTYHSTWNVPLSFTDERGRTTDYTIDSQNGNVLTVTGPAPSQGADRPVTTYTYTSEGFVETATLPDPDGSGPRVSPVIEYEYEDGRLVKIINPDLTTVVLAWDTAGRLISRTDELGRATVFVWDDLDRLVETHLEDPDGQGPLEAPVFVRVYDAVGNLIVERDPAGNDTVHEYDERNRRIQTTLPAPASGQPAPVWQWVYNPAGELITVIDPLLNETSYGRDGAGRVTSITLADPDGAGPQSSPVTTYTLDNLGRVTEVTDARGGKTSFLYDERSRVIERKDPDPDGPSNPLPRPVWTFSYTDAGELESITDPLSRVTSFEYDGLGRQVITRLPDPDGEGPAARPVYETVYDLLGLVVARIDATGAETLFEYDVRSRVISVTGPDPDGAGPLDPPVTLYSWTDAGELESVTDAAGRTTTWVRDGLGRVITTILPDPDGAGSEPAPEYHTAYDILSRVISETDSLGNVTQFEWDNLSRLVKRIDEDPDGAGPLGNPETVFTYDLVGNMLSLSDSVGNTTTWVYDNLYRVIQETNELNDSRFYTWNELGQLVSYTDRNGRVTERDFDGLGRLIEERWLDGQTTVNTLTFGYDVASQLGVAEDNFSGYAWTYDGLGRVTQTDNSPTPDTPNVVLTSEWDTGSRRTGLSATIDATADFANTYQFDALGRMTRIEQQGQSGGNAVAEKRVDLAYLVDGRFDTITRYADLAGTLLVATSTYGYDDAGRLTSLMHAQGTNTLAAYSWSYDAHSRITQFVSPDGTSDYSYDNTHQLLGAEHSWTTDEAYTFDLNGNRTSAGSATYTVGPNNRIESDGTHDYLYDAEGNRIRKTEIATGDYVEYTWDHWNRLTAVTFRDVEDVLLKRVEYVYDLFDRLITRRVDADGNEIFETVERFVYDTPPGKGGLSDVVLVFDGGGSLTHRSLPGPGIDQVLADEVFSDPDTLWFLHDHQNSVRDVASHDAGTGTTSIANHLEYDSFGNIRAQSNGSLQPQSAWTGRYRDPETGLQWNLHRWYDSTTGRWLSDDPIQFAGGDTNLQRYVANNPVNWIDPSGLFLSPPTGGFFNPPADPSTIFQMPTVNWTADFGPWVVGSGPEGGIFGPGPNFDALNPQATPLSPIPTFNATVQFPGVQGTAAFDAETTSFTGSAAANIPLSPTTTVVSQASTHEVYGWSGSIYVLHSMASVQQNVPAWLEWATPLLPDQAGFGTNYHYGQMHAAAALVYNQGLNVVIGADVQNHNLQVQAAMQVEMFVPIGTLTFEYYNNHPEFGGSQATWGFQFDQNILENLPTLMSNAASLLTPF